MGVNYNMFLDEAMKILNLKKGFTESEFKKNYKELMQTVHPDKVANLNPLAKLVIETYLKGNKHYSNSTNDNSYNNNYYKDTSEKYRQNYQHQEQYKKQQEDFNRQQE